ncbi:hypothetical protein F511_13965 [Dorcoceras hygrometricum]|uniref:Splicing factor 3B subunit 1-like n=1 Tax=Dorcoceras hygrometricum TaxID=472368 RepID=A0A2Z7CN52_9LAMI|nr:hypothetical protein F511_13965 [Dorcoceras hygrometricum]
MASDFFTNALQVNLDSVLGISDNDEMVNMFKALESTGLRDFLGCPSVLYEQELEQFFDTALVQDGDITCVVSGKYVAIPEDRFAGIFNLPTEGLNDLSERSNNLVLRERTLFSNSSVPVQFSCKKRLMKYEFRLLNNILAKSITVKAGSFYAVTHERFLMMMAIHFGDPAVTLGDAKTFPPLKILYAKMVNTYVATNKITDARDESEEPGMAKVTIVKKKSVSKKKSASIANKGADEVPVEVVAEKVVSKKRSAASSDAPVVKNTRTTTGKAASKKRDLGLVSVAPEAVPIQMIEPISAVPAERPPVPKRNALKRKFRMPAAERLVETGSDTVDEMETAMKEESEPLSKVLETSVLPTSDDESLSLEEHLAQIFDGMMLPSLTAAEPTKIKFCRGIEIRGVEAGDWYKENLPKIAATDKGKKPLEEPDTRSTETQNQKAALSLEMLKYQKEVRAPHAVMITDLTIFVLKIGKSKLLRKILLISNRRQNRALLTGKVAAVVRSRLRMIKAEDVAVGVEAELQALEEEDGSAADEERSAGAKGPGGTEAKKSPVELKLSAVVKRSAREKRRRTGRSISRELQPGGNLELAIAKRCRSNKLVRQRFAFALRIQQKRKEVKE